MKQLGITEQHNQVKLWRSADRTDEKGVVWSDKELHSEPIFRKHDKGIEIIVYNLDRSQPTYTGEGSRWKKNWSIVRLEKPIVKANGDTIKYLMPKGQGSYPFFPPQLVDKFDEKKPIKTIFVTEGFFKAHVACMHGADVIGVASITHIRNKESGGLHPDILKLMNTCKVERMVWLTDGDALDVSSKALNPKEEVDLYKRPASFYASISTFKQVLDDHEVDKYFMHVDTDAIMQELKPANRDIVKGIDDIMVTYPDKIPEIVADLNMVSKNGFWFQRFNISIGMSKVRDYFRLHNVNAFILFHQERNPALKGKEFVFHGTKYKYDEVKGECEVMIPGDANLYFRVGNDYYKWLQLPNQYKQLEKQFHDRSKSTIMDDHGKLFIKHVPKYEAFCNVPDHINYQQVIHNCFNVYSQIDHVPDDQVCGPEDFPAITGFLYHIFGEKEVHFTPGDTKEKKVYKTIELCLDYLQILYLQPWRKLPILCLVSKENNTGKSTFANFLRLMLGANVAIVGNQDLAGDFNAHWSTKSVVVCDETKIDKQHVIEKIKSLSTARKIWMNAKGKGQIELDCFIKFVLITNNEENFIYAGDDDIRYWVIKVPVLKLENPGILELFVEEMPAFLSYLSNRKLATENRNRMWFHPDLLKTDALRKVIQHSQPTIQKELTHNIREIFLDFGITELNMTLNAIRKEFFNNRFEANYVKKIIEENLKADHFHKLDPDNPDMFGDPAKIYVPTRFTYPRWEEMSREPGKPPEKVRVDVKDNGRPYVFKRETFLTAEELKQVQLTPEQNFLNEEKPADLPF